MTSLWFTALAGLQAVVRWQSSHIVLVEMCVADLPVAVVPLWQLAHVPVTLEWLKVAGVHAVVWWQVPHSAEVWMWVAGLPVALVPLWQLEQVPVTSL